MAGLVAAGLRRAPGTLNPVLEHVCCALEALAEIAGVQSGFVPETWLTTADIATRFGVTERTAVNWCRRGELEGATKSGGAWRAPLRAVAALAAERAV